MGVYVRRIWGEKERVGIKKEKSRIETVPVKADRGGEKRIKRGIKKRKEVQRDGRMKEMSKENWLMEEKTVK